MKTIHVDEHLRALASLLLPIVLLMIMNCTYDTQPNRPELIGRWAAIGLTDTIQFGYQGIVPVLWLKRGKEIVNGIPVEKPGAGTYEYEVKAEKIFLRFTDPISSGDFKEYSFQHSGDEIIVENFYDNVAVGIPVTFRRLIQ